jgi:hypothetical protein
MGNLVLRKPGGEAAGGGATSVERVAEEAVLAAGAVASGAGVGVSSDVPSLGLRPMRTPVAAVVGRRGRDRVPESLGEHGVDSGGVYDSLTNGPSLVFALSAEM